MEVRHNTVLLERALEHAIRRASIPLIQAEAAAHDKRVRAESFRRLATGAAIAVSGVGIGLALYLSRAPREVILGSPASSRNVSEAQRPDATRSVDPGRREKAEEPQTPPSATSPDAVTTNFTIFNQRTAAEFGAGWTIVAGHAFTSERDYLAMKWSSAWCYTEKLVDGVDVKLGLADRPSPDAIPVLSQGMSETMKRLGLEPTQVSKLASYCPWLDKREFQQTEIRVPPDPVPSSTEYRLEGSTLVVRGPIENGMLDRIQAYTFDRLQIDSIGGSIDEALRLGEWLRNNNKQTFVKSECYSACVFILAGGTVRQASDAALIGVHRFYKDSQPAAGDVELGQAKAADILGYLRQMGISDELWFAMSQTPSAEMHLIGYEQLRQWNVLTGPAPSTQNIPVVEIPDRPGESEPVTNASEKLSDADGYDAIGNDLSSMPLTKIDLAGCESRCVLNPNCVAVTYNKRARACFLKGQVGTLFADKNAFTAYRANQAPVTFSSIVLYPRTLLDTEPSYWRRTANYGECIVACDRDSRCHAFSSSSNSCLLFERVGIKVSNPTYVSGIK